MLENGKNYRSDNIATENRCQKWASSAGGRTTRNKESSEGVPIFDLS